MTAPEQRSPEANLEPGAWAEVEARWDDPAAHRAYLARFPDLDGLATAGRRYRAALEARPGDAVALAMKAEVVKRATVVGLAMLPRTPQPALAGGKWKRRALLALASWLASALAWLLWRLLNGSPS
jgi:hypothetical protein